MKQTEAATPTAKTRKAIFATLKPEFIYTAEEISFLESLPDNLPETKLSQKQKDGISQLYYKYLAGKVVKGWGAELYEVEQRENWPSGPRVKRHEAQRMILGNLLELNKYRKELTAQEAASKFFHCLTCRESYTILLNKVYNLKN